MSTENYILKDNPSIYEKLKRTDDKELLENLHFFLFGEPAKRKGYKRKILSFSGFGFQENSEDYEKYSEHISTFLSINNLHMLCDFFGQTYSVSATSNELTHILLKYFAKSKNIPEKVREMNAMDEIRTVRSTMKSKRSQVLSNKTHPRRCQTILIDIQKDINEIQEKMFSKHIIIIILESELEAMNNNGNSSAQELKAKEIELAKKTKLLKIQEERLKSKETLFLQHENIFQKVNDSSSEEMLSEDEASQNGKLERTQEWANQTYEKPPEFPENYHMMEGLTKSINNMLSRQTIGNQIINFDGSSCLKWPIFSAQYKLSNEVCAFSPQENVLRLNNSISGEARKTVEMLLITAQKPDEILDILQQKYGRPELIMEELLSKAHEIPVVETLDSFLNFSSTVRNLASVIEGDIALFVDQRYLLASFVNKLPPHLLTQWGSYLIEKNVESHKESLKDFSNWIQKMSEAVSRITFVSKNGRNNSIAGTSHEVVEEHQPSQKKLVQKSNCKLCNEGDHRFENCHQFLKADVKQRWKMVQKYHICFCCLRSHHGKCKNRKACGLNNCDRFHHNLLHKNNEIPTTRIPRNIEVNTCVNEITCGTLLKMIPVRIKGPNGVLNTTALLDEGSTTTLIDSLVAAELGLSGPIHPLCCKWTGEIYRFDGNSRLVEAEIAGKNSNFHSLRNVRTVEDLKLPEQKYDLQAIIQQYPFVQQVVSELTITEKPTLLIGQNNAHLIVSKQVIQPHPSYPILSKTKIGWTLHGSVENFKGDVKSEIAIVCCEEADERLHELVKSFMKIDNFGVIPTYRNQRRSKEDERAISIAEESIQLKEGQYVVKLPWKYEDMQFPESKQMAMQRLQCLERRLNRDGDFAKAYCAEIDKIFQKKYAVPVQPHELQELKRIWFVPHFPVRNPNKPKKVRVVFDAAARSNGYSLNDFLLTGPDLLASHFGILLRFRIRRIAFVGDICEMFNRVRIADEDTFSQCFLWRNLKNNMLLRVYRMTAMMFGTTSSPFLAQFVKNHNAQKYLEKNPAAANAIIQNHYVDDYLDSTDSEEEAIELVNHVIQIHSEGGFVIRNFISNSRKVIDGIPKHLVSETQLAAEVDKNSNPERILGMMWNPDKDCFTFKLKFHKIPIEIHNGTKVPTKRQVLKTAMSVYDPIGMLSPIVIKVKILLQKIWRAGLGWDDCITENMYKKWLSWLKELREVMELEIPRCYSPQLNAATSIELHVFSDASEDAYATAIYLRMEFENQHVQVILVTSKARVCPLKSLSIPKLELLAALMGVRLSLAAVKYLDLDFHQKYYWTDSRTVLHWLRSDKKLQTYVATRVGEILEYTDPNQWKWVPTLENVADDCTRENLKNGLNATHRWFNGPEFLHHPESSWPIIPVPINDSVTMEAILQNVDVNYGKEQCILNVLPSIKYHYSWIKLLRITARIFQFISMVRRTWKEDSNSLRVEDLTNSEKLWWRGVQCSCFPKDLSNLQNNTKNKAGRLHHLTIFLDMEGIIRISSRIIKMSEMPFSVEKEPVVLDGSHSYTQKMIMHFHIKNAHQGVETVINELRQNFWIPQIRSVVKKTIRTCSYCKRRLAREPQPIMGLLPKERLLVYEKPFSATGLDYFGPFEIKIGRRIEKRYGVLFTCLTVRAIHVEIAHSLSTDSCIMAIRRFLARRGAVRIIWSDNATNIRGASRELMEALSEMEMLPIIDEMTNRGITFKRIPPLSPFMGGSWERMIGCFKRTIAAVLRDRHPTGEVLQTVFAEAEYLVNSRPLSHVSDDPNDLVSISPNDILLGKSSEIITPGVFTEKDLLLRKQWRLSQYLLDIFWRRWLKEYLPTLISRSKWTEREPNLEIGEMVIINEKNIPRGMWPLGKIVKTYEGEDGTVRVADVRTSQGVFKRPARKLFRLNIRIDENRVNTGGDNVEET